MVGTFSGKKSLKALSNKVFIFIQQTLPKRILINNLSCLLIHPINISREAQLFVGLVSGSVT
ncbi:hypothetical protein B1L04_06990 [Microcystis aeruginosa KW]|uniref:Uncharacterized protein n=1 Tax=Microcystis aeruginosa KW TaxID=1960155 RepID=A0A1V4BWQ0_MICAE|nr:hypothetical protein B1L04_06990 [Microcystis aeruginosa KW]